MPKETLTTRAAFAERIRLQLRSRYSGADVDIDEQRFVVRVVAPGIDASLPLAPLYQACEREPSQAPALIARYVASVERQMTPRYGAELSLNRLVWCVRSRAYLANLARSDELLTVDVAADVVAFVAEDLPGSVMRGVPRDEWQQQGTAESTIRDAADANTAARFARLVERINAIERIPADGWRMAGDPLYQTSVVMAPDVVQSLVARSEGDVLLGLPDRGLVLAIPAAAANADRFHRRVLRDWREALNPCSRRVLITDGSVLRESPHRRGRGSATVLPWLED